MNSQYTGEEKLKGNNHMKKDSSSVMMKYINKNNNRELLDFITLTFFLADIMQSYNIGIPTHSYFDERI